MQSDASGSQPMEHLIPGGGYDDAVTEGAHHIHHEMKGLSSRISRMLGPGMVCSIVRTTWVWLPGAHQVMVGVVRRGFQLAGGWHSAAAEDAGRVPYQHDH